MALRWPAGITSAGGSCGIKGADLPDLGLVIADRPSTWAGVFTRNAAAAAPVLWCRERLGSDARAIVVNSGNANACTGPEGAAAVERTVVEAARLLDCEPTEVLVASTGVIGVRLPVELICAGLPTVVSSATPEVDAFARSILTTDTTEKTAAVEVGGATFTGVAKGAAMLAPNMATMLAFVATDATADASTVRSTLGRAVDASFNRISVDACESTNDSVFALATGRGPALREEDLVRGFTEVCRDLALQMVRDAEGGSKLVRITIEGARDEGHAVALGRAVAASALWRAAVHGADPNWGRIAAALGQEDRDLSIDDLEIAIGPEVVFSAGRPTGGIDIAKKAMTAPEFDVTCTVGVGSGVAEILTCDLSTAYVVENAWGTT